MAVIFVFTVLGQITLASFCWDTKFVGHRLGVAAVKILTPLRPCSTCFRVGYLVLVISGLTNWIVVGVRATFSFAPNSRACDRRRSATGKMTAWTEVTKRTASNSSRPKKPPACKGSKPRVNMMVSIRISVVFEERDS